MFLKPFNMLNVTKRFVGKKKFVWEGDYIQYPGFKYYPSKPDFQDPPYQATKLFRVRRIQPLKGTPYFEKHILRDLKLDGKLSDVVILKNMPETNSMLWKIKHLVEIKPVTFPDGFPTDINGTYLKENGELIVTHKVSQDKQLSAENCRADVKRLDGNTLRRNSRMKWINGWDKY